MLIAVESTYRGKHGLYIGGHTYDLTKGQISDITDELASRKEKFHYREIRDPKHINRPARKQSGSPSDKQLHEEQTK